MRGHGAVIAALLGVVLNALDSHPMRGQSNPAPVADQHVDATEVDPDAFGFSAQDLASSLAVKVRGLLGSKSAVDQVRSIVDPAALKYSYYRPALEVLSAWTANSTLAGLVRINQPLKPGFVNFFILDHTHLAAKAPGLACNCSYVPDSWSIVCDEKFLARAQRLLESNPVKLESVNPDKKDDNAEVELQLQQMFRSFLFEWMIAHELGHLAHNHTAKDLTRSWDYGNGIAVGLAAEKEADEFYVSRMQHDQQRQFGAWMGLSNVITRLYGQAVRAQHTPEEIRAQVEKNGPAYIFDAELRIKLNYVPTQHPPLLVRALNLAPLVIARYPQMFDSSGYFANVRAHIDLNQSAKPDSPELCIGDEAARDQDSSEEQVLAKQLDILLLQSAPREWIEPLVGKLRKLVDQQSDPAIKKLSSLATDLSEALAQPDPAKLSPRLETIERGADDLPAPHNATLRLLTFAARARAGLLPDSVSARDAVKDAERQINDLVTAGAIDPSKPSEKAEALRLLLQVGLAPGKTRDVPTNRLLDAIIVAALKLADVAEIDKQTLLQIVQADFARMTRDSHQPETVETAADAALRAVLLTDTYNWPLLEVKYLTAQIALLERVTPRPLGALMNGYFALGRELQFVGLPDASPEAFQRAIDTAEAALGSKDASEADKAAIANLRLEYLNDLGWSLLIARKFPEALTPLNSARDGRIKERAQRTTCDRSHSEDAELATVNQNLADVSLALGRYADAANYAHQARQCRTELGRTDKIIESTKTEGYALIYSGDRDAGLALLRDYSSSIRRRLDDDQLPPGDPFISGAIVDGRFVPLEDFVQIPDKNLPRKITSPAITPDDVKEKK